MQWDDVRYFLELVRQGSLSATARSLAVEHSTVARRISQLEHNLQLRLFDRLPRGWRLSQEGQAVLPQALAIEASMLALQRSAGSHSLLSGRVRLSVPPLLLTYVVLPLLDKFRELYPEIDLDLVGDSRYARLEQGEADLALRLGEGLAPDLIAKPIASLGYALYACADWHDCDPDQQVFIGFDEDLPKTSLKIWLDEVIAGRRQIIRSNDLAVHFSAASRGWGIALLPHFLAREAGQLLRLPSSKPIERQLYLVMHPDLRKAARVRCLADYLIAQLAIANLN